MQGSPIIVGMSGGVDSSVAALRLLEQGFEVRGLFMKNWEEEDDETYCAAAADLADARQVCDRLGIELETVNFAAEYWQDVFRHFLAGLERGLTPNPDVLCNREIKFRAFLDHALAHGAGHIATGHYARIRRIADACILLTGVDPAKDQSYFLHLLDQRALSHALFPIGELDKSQVRVQARAAGLATHDKKDSTGICFIGERRFADFLRRYVPTRPGEVRALDGRVVGEHSGLAFLTVGQRQGLGIGGAGEPWYVADKDVAANVLYVVQGREHPALYGRTIEFEQAHWITAEPSRLPLECQARIRYRQKSQPCRVMRGPDGILRARFHTPQWAPTPGQSVVFYQDEQCLGGGVIRRAEPDGQHAGP